MILRSPYPLVTQQVTTISGTVTGGYPTHLASRVGPFDHNGNLYVIVQASPNLNVMKSTDGGANWTQAGQLTTHSGAGIYGVQVGSTIFFGATNSNTGNTAMGRQFDMATDTLTSTSSSGNACNPTMDNTRGIMYSYRAANGDFMFMRQGSFESVGGTNYRRAVIDYRNTAASNFNNSTPIDGLIGVAAHGDFRGIYTDSLDRVWLFYTRSNATGSLFCRLLQPGGGSTVSGEFTVATDFDALSAYGVGHPTEYTQSSTVKVALVYRSSSGAFRLAVSDSVTSPAFTTSALTTGTATGFPGSLIRTTDNLLRAFQIRSDGIYWMGQSAVGGSFNNPSLWVAGSVTGLGARTVSPRAALAYVDGTTVRYRAASLTLPSTTTVTLRPRAGGDDGFTFDDGGTGGFNNGANFLVVNDISNTAFDYQTFVLLTLDEGQVLPQGKTIVKAELVLDKSGGASGATSTRFTFQNADNPTAPTSRSDVLDTTNRPRISPVTSWTPSTSWNTDEVRRVSVKDLVQAIVNRTDYNSGRMLLFWTFPTSGWGGENNNYQVHSYNASPTRAPYLEVTYE